MSEVTYLSSFRLKQKMKIKFFKEGKLYSLCDYFFFRNQWKIFILLLDGSSIVNRETVY